LVELIGVIIVAPFAVLLALTVALAVYRTIRPIPKGQRAFIPEFTCHANIYEGEVCRRTCPPPGR